MRAFFINSVLITLVLLIAACTYVTEENTPETPKVIEKQLVGSWLFVPTDSARRVGDEDLNNFYFCSLDLFSDSTFTYWYQSHSGECRGAIMLGLYSLDRTSGQLSFNPENHFLAPQVRVLSFENDSMTLQLPGKDLVSLKWKRTNGIIKATFERNSSKPNLEFKKGSTLTKEDMVNVIYL